VRTLTRRGVEALFASVVVSALGLWVVTHLAPAVGYGLYAVRSGSMSPALEVGDLVVTRLVDPSEIEPGDVITSDTGGRAVVTHRVITVQAADDGPVFTTRGDANPTPDPLVARADQFHGRVDWRVPLLGFVLAMIAMPMGILALVSIAAALLTAAWLLDEDDLPVDAETSPGDEPVPDLCAAPPMRPV
jgi:signal peptidase I